MLSSTVGRRDGWSRAGSGSGWTTKLGLDVTEVKENADRCCCLREVDAKMSKICPRLTPVWDEGEAALRSPWPHPARATGG